MLLSVVFYFLSDGLIWGAHPHSLILGAIDMICSVFALNFLSVDHVSLTLCILNAFCFKIG